MQKNILNTFRSSEIVCVIFTNGFLIFWKKNILPALFIPTSMSQLVNYNILVGFPWSAVLFQGTGFPCFLPAGSEQMAEGNETESKHR